jgi:hypothetical protein
MAREEVRRAAGEEVRRAAGEDRAASDRRRPRTGATGAQRRQVKDTVVVLDTVLK